MSDNLKQKAAKGIIWKFLDQGGTQLIQFITGIYIARILYPGDYGLIGMMGIFLGISSTLGNSGLRSILIQKGDDVSQDDYNAAFYFNFIVSLFCYLFIYLGAPKIAHFYNESRLERVAPVLGLVVIFTSLSYVPRIILTKRLNFKTISKINLLSVAISIIAGIVLAKLRYGVWALVAMVLVKEFLTTVLLWLTNKWRPDFQFSFQVFRGLFRKSYKLLITGLLNQVSSSIFSVIIGKGYSTADVGYYGQGSKLQRRISELSTTSIQGVMFPVQSLVKDNLERLKNTVRQNIKYTTLVAFPALTGLFVVAKPFVFLFLKQKWEPSIVYIYILSISGVFAVLNAALGSYLIPLGKYNFVLRFSIFKNILFLALVAIALLLKFNLVFLVSVRIVYQLITYCINIYYAQKYVLYKLNEQFTDIIKSAVFSLLMGILIYTVGKFIGLGYVQFFAQAILGAVSYFILSYTFNKELVKPILDWLTQQIKQKRTSHL